MTSGKHVGGNVAGHLGEKDPGCLLERCHKDNVCLLERFLLLVPF